LKTNKTQIFIGAYLDHTIEIKGSYLDPKKANLLVTRLNKAGFCLGSGHEIVELTEDTKGYVLFLLPYYGHPSQCVRFEPKIEKKNTRAILA